MLWALYYMPLEKRVGIDAPSVLVEAANGQPLGRVGPLSDAVKRRDFPDTLVKAVLSIEDRRFYSHWGIDPWGIARATQANWAAGGIAEGGSTITQQLVKMQIVGNERNLGRKVREAFTAIWLDLRLGKDEVLVYLGAGAYGMSAATRLYFDKSLADLTLPEAALLDRPDPGAFQVRSDSKSRCGASPGCTGYRRHARERRDRCDRGREGKSAARNAEAFVENGESRRLVHRLDRQARASQDCRFRPARDARPHNFATGAAAAGRKGCDRGINAHGRSARRQSGGAGGHASGRVSGRHGWGA
jgi:hypothetical protein